MSVFATTLDVDLAAFVFNDIKRLERQGYVLNVSRYLKYLVKKAQLEQEQLEIEQKQEKETEEIEQAPYILDLTPKIIAASDPIDLNDLLSIQEIPTIDKPDSDIPNYLR
jgi:hypothetical protein